MSVIRAEDDPIRTRPSHRPARLADVVGRGVAYDQGYGDTTHHGTIVSANYSLSGEPVVVVHPDSRHGETPANTVLYGAPAAQALEHLDGAGLSTDRAYDSAVDEALAVDQAARRRLTTEQARTLPGPGTTAPASYSVARPA